MGVHDTIQAGVEAIKEAVVDQVPAVRPDLRTWIAIIGLMLGPVFAFGGWAISQHTRTTVLEQRVNDHDRRLDKVEDVVFEPLTFRQRVHDGEEAN